MKTYKKNKFHFLWDDGTKKIPKNGENYFRSEWRFIDRFPFLKKEMIHYRLIKDVWVEQN
ncbi:MAG: hypothetical protein ACOC2W_03160 [bacterium]